VTLPRPSPAGGEGGTATRAEVLRELRQAFAGAGLDTPALDARLLVAAALGITPMDLALRPDAPMTPAEARSVEAFKARRLAREPVARILGEAEFWGLPFRLSPDTLVPRPDTETLVETALRLVPERSEPLTLLDLGTGSGCLLVALLHEYREAVGIGLDRSLGALATARGNACRNGVGERAFFVRADWAAPVRGPVDLVVSNPPYIASAIIPDLDRDVREHDPVLALDGGPDGLAAYRAILADAPRLLRPGGLLLLEIGYDQGEKLEGLTASGPLETLGIHPDLSGNPRCVALKRT
jgi:release factor glutamine methyltransferase